MGCDKSCSLLLNWKSYWQTKITRRDLKTINILNIYQVLMSATISKCEVCGLEFGILANWTNTKVPNIRANYLPGIFNPVLEVVRFGHIRRLVGKRWRNL